MAFFMVADQPAVWRGPMVNSAFDRMAVGSDWGKLDVMIVDMPPGENRDGCVVCFVWCMQLDSSLQNCA